MQKYSPGLSIYFILNISTIILSIRWTDLLYNPATCVLCTNKADRQPALLILKFYDFAGFNVPFSLH